MPYTAIFTVTYLVVAIVVFVMLARKTAQVGANMLNQGMPRESVDDLYRSMKGKTLMATLQVTAITGTILGGLISLVVRVLK